MTGKEKENCYVNWMIKFKEDNELLMSDYGIFNDIVDGFVGGRWNIKAFGGSHESDYWKNMDIVMDETIANYSSINALQLKPLENAFNQMMPNLAKITKEGWGKIWNQ